MRNLTLVLFLSHFFSAPSFGWGERGHDIVTRVAARLVYAEDPHQWGAILRNKEHQLAHLANVPDIVWRNGDAATKAANAPTHYFDIDALFAIKKPFPIESLPRSLQELDETIQSFCAQKTFCPKGKTLAEKRDKVGTAPYRIEQLYLLLVKSLQSITPKNLSSQVDQALLYAGILSHFVADLGNPHHCTLDFDGREISQGGAHKYFETDIVTEEPLGLAQKVFETASSQPLDFKGLTTKKPSLKSPLDFTFLLILDSYQHLDTLNQLDRQHAIKKLAQNDEPALRHPPAEARSKLAPLAIKRMARAAQVLATLWKKAYLDAHLKDLKAYQSYHYPYKPDFIPFP